MCSLVDNADLLAESKREWLKQEYPEDVIERAIKIHKAIKSTGSYSHSQGIKMIREDVAKFIEERDGHPSCPEQIFLSNGASTAVQMSLQAVIQGRDNGVMIPIPQYPLYTATLAMVDGTPVPYYLNEEDNWGLSVEELTNSLKKAEQFDIDTRALVVINPGNPTGQCLSRSNMEEIIKFCKANKITLMADEVYQTNIYDPENFPFISFKKVLTEMGPEYKEVELISFHSTSKGFIGECGKRGGYMELTGILPEVRDQFYKAASICLCPNVMGQIVVDCMVNPPKPGEPSYELYKKETSDIYESLKRRANVLCRAFNEMEGVTCQYSNGAMYAFPRVRLPAKAIQAAHDIGKAPDTFYCLKMLEETGVSVVSGTGFHQKEDTWHFRSTFLPPEDTFATFTKSIQEFHKEFMDKYRD